MNEDENKEEQTFYREIIEAKPVKPVRRILAVFLVLGLLIGTVLGAGIDKYLLGETPGPDVVYATAATDTTGTVNNSAISPVVPIAKKVSPAIVAIKISSTGVNMFGDAYESEGTGSGIIIDSSGHIVTNNHVVEGAKSLTVILKDGTEIPGTLVGRDPLTDLAVIQVNKENLAYAEMGDSSKLEVGELAVAIGSPMGTDYAGSVTAGIISGLDRKVSVGDKTMNLIQTDAAINPGNSGGALVNSQGNVVGINTLKLVENKVEGMGFAIPINEAKPIIEEIIKNKKISRPYLGIQGITVTKDDAQSYGLPQGVYVHEVETFSGADRAGIKSGSVITKIDGTRICTIEELVAKVRNHKVNDVVKIEIFDETEKSRTLSVKLMESQEH